MTLKVKKITQLEILDSLKQAFFSQSTAALDGMWHFGFVPKSSHFGFYKNDELVGFCCVNDNKQLLQFYLPDRLDSQARKLFSYIVNNNSSEIREIRTAFVSTAEPSYLSLCFDNSSRFRVNALMYQQHRAFRQVSSKSINLSMANYQQLDSLVAFAIEATEAPQHWLEEYYTHLIGRQELWLYSVKGNIVASGECRRFDEYQRQFADLGVITSPSCRGQGVATRVLSQLASLANEHNLKPICSTESNNIAAQKAISKAGFYAANRIIEFSF